MFHLPSLVIGAAFVFIIAHIVYAGTSEDLRNNHGVRTKYPEV